MFGSHERSLTYPCIINTLYLLLSTWLLVQPSKIRKCSDMTEILLTGMQSIKANNPTKGWFEFCFVWNAEDRFSYSKPYIMFSSKDTSTPLVNSVESNLRCTRRVYLTRYSIITPFDAFEMSCIWKYYGKWSICSFGANAPFSIIFSKVFETLLKFILTFFNVV